MKLYIKRDKSTDKSMFVVFDEHCNEKYYVVGSKDKFELINLKNEKLMKIRRIPLPALNAFSISAYKRNIKFITGSSTSKVQCYYYGIGWRIRGNIFIKSFDILDADNSLVATHSKCFSQCSDGYELNVIDEDMELFSLATALCVNLVAKVDNPCLQAI